MPWDGTCPDAEECAALLDGQLSTSAIQQVRDHADGCPDCTELMVALGADSHPPLSPSPSQATRMRRRLPMGTHIGPYVVESFLGQGSSGTVYAAYDPRLDRRVALKILWEHSARAREHIREEARTLASLSHPSVIGVLDVGEQDGRLWLATELIEGNNLLLSSLGNRWDQALRVCLRAGRALAAAHEAGIVHRDFKPENVLVDGERVVVLDFGLARREDCRAQTAAGAQIQALDAGADEVVGTPAYMSPEQHLGERATVRSDQFSFCMVVAELLYGRRPFEGRSADDVLDAILTQEPDLGGRGVPRQIEATLRRGLARDPADRFATMRELMRELRGAAMSAGSFWALQKVRTVVAMCFIGFTVVLPWDLLFRDQWRGSIIIILAGAGFIVADTFFRRRPGFVASLLDALSPLAYSGFPALIVLVQSLTYGPEYGLTSWAAPLLGCTAIAVTSLLMKPIRPIIMSLGMAASYAAAHLYLLDVFSDGAPDLVSKLHPIYAASRAFSFIVLGLIAAYATHLISKQLLPNRKRAAPGALRAPFRWASQASRRVFF